MKLTTAERPGAGWWLWLALLFSIGLVRAQVPEAVERRYRIDASTVESGLPSGVINAVLQTSEGYLWLGTANGLVRFDGVRFTVYPSSPKPEFASSRISVLHEDANGVMWIGTEGGGVVSYKEGEFKTYSVASGLAGDSVSAITSDTQGNLWVATVGGALSRYRSGEFTPFTPRGEFGTGTIESLADAGAGTLWWCNGSTLGTFREGEFQATSSAGDDRLRIGAVGFSRFWLLEKSMLRRWITGSPSGDPIALPEGVEAAQVTALYQDREGALWLGTSGAGLYLIKDGAVRRFTTQDGLSQNSILCITQDKEGNLWVGTNGGGLNRLRESAFEIYDTKRGLSQNIIYSIAGGRDGSVWIGTDGGGLNRVRDGEVARYGPMHKLDSLTVWSVLEDRAGMVWAGTRNGLYKFNGLRFERVGQKQDGGGLASQDIRCLYEDSKDRLWVGTFGGGISRIVDNRATLTFNARTHPEFFTSSGSDVRALIEDKEGSLWIGTGGGGLIRFKDASFNVFRKSDGLTSDFIRVLFVDSEGLLWIGTNTGLTCLRRGRFIKFTTATSLPDDVISQIFEDDRGNLWLGTNRGVVKVSRRALLSFADGRVPSFTTVLYDRSDGLAGRECNGGFQPSGYKDPAGKLWIPTSEGVSVVDPANIRPNPRPPQVIVEAVLANGTVIEPRRYTNTAELDERLVYRIPPGTDRLEFHYTGLSYVAPRRIRFTYQLKGYDATPQDGENRRAALYLDVPPGKYSFQVQAANSDGVPNVLGRVVGVLVLPRFYQTIWFQAGMSLLVIFFVFAFFRYLSIRKLRQRLVVLEQQRALDRERTRIAQDMHDDLGARITRIGLLTELVRRKVPQNEEMNKVSARIEEATREVVHTLDEIVWAVNPKNDTLDRLAAFIAQYADDYFEITPIRCRLDLPSNLPPLPLSAEMRHSLFLVVKESLNNIAKHSEASEVRITLTYEHPRLRILIEDNGKGFSLEEANPTRNGLMNMKKRIEEAGGKLDLASEKGKGTRIQLEIKLGT